MAKSIGNLIPTRVVRKDGHVTTVHKKSGLDASGASKKLSSITPTLNTQPRSTLNKVMKVSWSSNSHASNNKIGSSKDLPTSKGSLVSRLGLDVDGDARGEAKLTHGDCFEYLRLGVSVTEAAFLSSIKSIDEWKEDELFQQNTPGAFASDRFDQPVKISEAVDFLRDSGMTPVAAQQLLNNGLQDQHVHGVLNAEELQKLFKRFNYQSSRVGEKTNAAATLDAFVDGRLPIGLAEESIHRPVVTKALDSVYPTDRKGARGAELSDEARDAFRNDPDLFGEAIMLLHEDNPQGLGELNDAYNLLQQFGREACMGRSAYVMSLKRSDGTYYGPEGDDRYNAFKNLCESKENGSLRVVAGSKGVTFNDLTNRSAKKIAAEDFLHITDAGASVEDMYRLIFEENLTSAQARAVVEGTSSAAIASGWL